ncbi:MAG: hypothetical protein PHQ19_10075 [Candidatus Krumholzibacteria bacterium]|nr:hypothetical protein [Candidatus Krumholzibacteria bacterium]
MICTLCFVFPQSVLGEKEGAKSGLIVEIDGDVIIRRESGPHQAYPSFVLRAGDTIVVDKASRCSGFTPGGMAFALRESEKMIMTTSSKGGLGRWFGGQLLDFTGETSIRTLLTRSSRGWNVDVRALLQLFPAHQGSVRPGEPEFFWRLYPGIDRYRVTVIGSDGTQFERVTNGCRIMIEDLQPGTEYDWRVEPALDCWTAQSRWSHFRVMTREEESALDSVLVDLPELEAAVLLFISGLCGEAVDRLDFMIESGRGGPSVFMWRAKALAAAELYAEANVDLMRFYRNQ